MRKLILILAVWAAGLGAAAQFGKMSVLYEGLAAGYPGRSALALGLIVSVVGFVGLIFGTTAGLLVARIGARRALVGALLAGAAVSAVQALGLPYALLIVSRTVEGFSHLAIVVVGPLLIAEAAQELKGGRWQGAAMTLWSTFFGLTYAILALLAPPVMAAFGPAGVFYGHAVWMLGVALLLSALLPPDRKAAGPGLGSPAALWQSHVAIYRSPWIAAPAMGFFFYTVQYVAYLTLLPPEIPFAQRAFAAAGMPLISIVVSLTLGVWLLGRMPAVRVVRAGLLASLPGLLALGLFWGSGWGMALAGLWISAAMGLAQGASFASIPELNPGPEARAAAAGAIAQLGNVGTTIGTPLMAVMLAGGGPWALALTGLGASLAGLAVIALQARRRAAGAD